MWVVDGNGGVLSCWKTSTDANGYWSRWEDFLQVAGSLDRPVRDLTVAPLSDGRLQLWALDDLGSLVTCWKVDGAHGYWTGWRDFRADQTAEPTALSHVAAVPLADGRLQVIVVDESGVVRARSKADRHPDAAWGAWVVLYPQSPGPRAP